MDVSTVMQALFGQHVIELTQNGALPLALYIILQQLKRAYPGVGRHGPVMVIFGSAAFVGLFYWFRPGFEAASAWAIFAAAWFMSWWALKLVRTRIERYVGAAPSPATPSASPPVNAGRPAAAQPTAPPPGAPGLG